MGRNEKRGYTFINSRKLEERDRKPKDTFPELAKILSRTKPIVETKIERTPLPNIRELLESNDRQYIVTAVELLCMNIEELEEIMKKNHLSTREAEELRQSTKMLSKALPVLDEYILNGILETTNSIQLCMAVINGNFPGSVMETAEKRIAEIEA